MDFGFFNSTSLRGYEADLSHGIAHSRYGLFLLS